MSQKSIELLQLLTQADSVPGHEAEVREIFRAELMGTGTIGTDRLGSIFCTCVGSAAFPRILLDSHLDEVGFIVQWIPESGYVKFLRLGGWLAPTLLAQRVTISTKSGKVPGFNGLNTFANFRTLRAMIARLLGRRKVNAFLATSSNKN